MDNGPGACRAKANMWVVDDRVRALIDSVREDPDARSALLAALMPDQVLAVPQRLGAVDDALGRLASAQARTEASVSTLTEQVTEVVGRVDALAGQMLALTKQVTEVVGRVDVLAGQMLGLTEQVTELVGRMDALTERMDALTERMYALVEAQRRTEIAVQTLSDRFGKQLPRIDSAIGYVVERRYEERASAYFAPIARRIRVLDRSVRDDLVDDALEEGRLTTAEARALRLTDTIARGRRGDDVVYLVVESSYTVDERDVQRAGDRSELLSRLVGTTIPIVAGEYIDEDAQRAATVSGTYQVLNGTVTGPDGLVLQ